MFIYHIAEKSIWNEALTIGIYTPGAYQQDGFIHCSLENQVLAVANRYYQQSNDLVLLKIDSDRIEVPLVFENLEGKEELFPHLYGPLPLNAVVESLPLDRDQHAVFIFPAFS